MPKISFFMVVAWIFFSAPSSFALEPEFMEVTEPKFMEVTEPEFLEVSKPGFAKVKQPEFSKPKNPEYLVPKKSSSGATVWSGKRENKAYKRCAKLKGFDEQHKCALDALGLTEDDIK